MNITFLKFPHQLEKFKIDLRCMFTLQQFHTFVLTDKHTENMMQL